MTESSEANQSDHPTTDELESKTQDELTRSVEPEGDAPGANAAAEPAPTESPPESETSEAPKVSANTPAEGWYPDPNAGGANVMRYWDGAAWTEKIKEGQTEINTHRRTDVERKAILAQQLQGAAARGLRIESQSEFQAILVKGQPINNTLHAILTIFTCLLWGIVWAVIAATGGEKREMIVVDEFGNVQYQRLGKA
jgi:hypothetical protein